MAELAGADAPSDGQSNGDLGGLSAGARGAQVAQQGDRRFRVGLALAIGLHGLLFAGFYGSPPRHIGKPDGDRNAVDVSFVSEDELRSLSSARAATPKASPSPPAPPPQPPAPEPPVEAKPPVPETPPTAQQPPQPEPTPEVPPVEEALTLKPIEDLIASTERKSEPKPAEPPKPQPPAKQPAPERKRQAALDLSPPANFSFGGGGGGAADVARPAGITRSGENDAFARGVISALRRTMPQLMDTRGRVTVRITLGKDGELVSTQVVHPSNIAGLDRSVVFATRQTSYPFPPRDARSVDLVFLITYIYQ